MAITKIGTKLISNDAVTTVKLGSISITRADVQSGSVQVGHLDFRLQGSTDDHTDILDGDYFIIGDKTKFDADNAATQTHVRSFSFSQLKTALSLSNAARGNEGAVQFKALESPYGFDGIAKITTDGVHLTASAGSKVVLAYTGISGSTGELYASAAGDLKINADTELVLHSLAQTQGDESIILESGSLRPIIKPQVAASPGTFRIVFTSGSVGPQSSGNPKTYGPLKTSYAQLVEVASTGSEHYFFYFNEAASPSPLPVSASINLEYASPAIPPKKRRDIAVEAVSGVSDWRDVVANLAAAMNTQLNTNASLATVTLNATSSVNGTASIEVTYNSSTIKGDIGVGTAVYNVSSYGRPSTSRTSALFSPSTNPTALEAFQGNTEFSGHGSKLAGEPESGGAFVQVVTSGSNLVASDSLWADLGQSSYKYGSLYVSVLTASTDNTNAQIHKITTDKTTVGSLKLADYNRANALSGSGTASLHVLSVTDGTFGGVKFSSVRAAAAYMITGSGTGQLHKLDSDLGTIGRVSSIIVTASAPILSGLLVANSSLTGNPTVTITSGSALSASVGDLFKVVSSGGTYEAVVKRIAADKLSFQTEYGEGSASGTKSFASVQSPVTLHQLNVDKGTIDRVRTLVVTGSGTSLFNKIDSDKATVDRVVATRVTSSGLTQLHNVNANDLTAISGYFHTLDVDHVDAAQITSSITTTQVLEISSKQIITAVSQSTGQSLAGAGLQIGGAAGSGSAGIASVVLGNIIGTNSDLLFKIGSTLGATLSGSANLPHQRLSVAGGVSASVGVFNNLTVNETLSASVSMVGAGAGNNFKSHQISGSNVQAHIVEADRLSVNDLSGSSLLVNAAVGTALSASATFSIFDADFDKLTVNDLDGTSATFSPGTFTGLAISSSMGVVTGNRDIRITSGSALTGSWTGARVRLDSSAGTYLATVASVAADQLSFQTTDARGSATSPFTLASLSRIAVSASTVTLHELDAEVAKINDVDVSKAISGSATSTLHKLTSDHVSGSSISVHKLGYPSGGGGSNYYKLHDLNVGTIVSTDVVKKEHLNKDIVQNNSDANGGLVYADGQLSIGWKRRIFSRSTRKLINRAQPTQGSGSLYTTCSLSEIRMVSGSESVFFNGLLLVKSNGAAGNPRDADYRIDYNGGGGLQPGTFRFVFTSGSIGAQSSGVPKTYGPMKTGYAQMVRVASTGSEHYFFYLNEAASPSPIPISASINLEYASSPPPPKKRRDISVEAVSGVSDWRDVVANLAAAMNTQLNTNASLATVTLNATSSINGTASIEVTYAAGTIEGEISAGAGTYTITSKGRPTTTRSSALFSPSSSPTALESFQGDFGGHGNKLAGEPDSSGVFLQVMTSGSTEKPGTEVFLHETLTMDSDDILVIQYLSGSGTST